eukprot:TRINITY_DN18320_c0_g1_i1.p1 TRINITY_DN18320_c0_g1~~TRINITY_DN18320_c0_g1_i1.p1  ORF type:complete len:135 (-),score=11.68 TRINITY_DN18320_c0_g1_i1:34-438(-)
MKLAKESSPNEGWNYEICEFTNEHLNNDLAQIEVMIPIISAAKTKTSIYADWCGSQQDMDAILFKVMVKLAKVTYLHSFALNCSYTNLNDEGCVALARILRNDTSLVSLSLSLHVTRITDSGMSFIAALSLIHI